MIALATAAGLLAGIAVAAGLLRRWEVRAAGRWLKAWRSEMESDLAAKARSRSAAVVTGQVLEQVAPVAEDFPWAPADVRFLGKPIDYLVFDGLSEVRRGERRRLREIVLVDVKTGQAGLTRSERRIRACVEDGRVELARMDRSGMPTRKAW